MKWKGAHRLSTVPELTTEVLCGLQTLHFLKNMSSLDFSIARMGAAGGAPSVGSVPRQVLPSAQGRAAHAAQATGHRHPVSVKYGHGYYALSECGTCGAGVQIGAVVLLYSRVPRAWQLDRHEQTS